MHQKKNINASKKINDHTGGKEGRKEGRIFLTGSHLYLLFFCFFIRYPSKHVPMCFFLGTHCGGRRCALPPAPPTRFFFISISFLTTTTTATTTTTISITITIAITITITINYYYYCYYFYYYYYYY